MTVFQAYCSNIDNPSIWRFVLTFPNSSVADEWWRAISDTPSIAPLFTRVTSQFYTQHASSFNITNFFDDYRTKDLASNFKGILIITLINDQAGRGIPIIKSLNIANAISGNWFFIRSTADPNLYWYHNPTSAGGNITVSATGRAAFCISAVDTAIADKVLIDTDIVTLQVEGTDLHLDVNDVKDVFAGVDAHQFLFGNLKNKIGFIPAYGFLKDQSDSPTNSGWKWELVE